MRKLGLRVKGASQAEGMALNGNKLSESKEQNGEAGSTFFVNGVYVGIKEEVRVGP